MSDREDFLSDYDPDWEPDFEANDDLGRDFPEDDPGEARKSFLDGLTDEQWLKLYEYALSISPQMRRIQNDAPTHFQPDE